MNKVDNFMDSLIEHIETEKSAVNVDYTILTYTEEFFTIYILKHEMLMGTVKGHVEEKDGNVEVDWRLDNMLMSKLEFVMLFMMISAAVMLWVIALTGYTLNWVGWIFLISWSVVCLDRLGDFIDKIRHIRKAKKELGKLFEKLRKIEE